MDPNLLASALVLELVWHNFLGLTISHELEGGLELTLYGYNIGVW